MIPHHHQQDFEVGELAEPVRLDKYLADTLDLFPRSQYDRRGVRVVFQAKDLKPSFKLEGGEVLQVYWNDLPETTFSAEDIPLDILYEDASTLVVNKPRGMVVHPAHGNWTGTLVQALLFHVKDLEDQFDSELRPGIVHRLDKETTGVLVTAKTPQALEFLSEQFRNRSTGKLYYAVLKGELRQKTGVLERYLGRDPVHRQKYAVTSESHGKIAITKWRVLAVAGGYTLVEFHPQTGRTHQLRVHALELQCPILGDPVYARTDARQPTAPLMLHAARLDIQLPGETEIRRFTAPLPLDFQTILKNLGLPDPLTCAPD